MGRAPSLALPLVTAAAIAAADGQHLRWEVVLEPAGVGGHDAGGSHACLLRQLPGRRRSRVLSIVYAPLPSSHMRIPCRYQLFARIHAHKLLQYT